MINRIIVDHRVDDEFLERFSKRVASLKYGDPSQEDMAFGPIDQNQFDHIRKLVDETIAAGARVVLDGPSQGLVMHPVILADVTSAMPAAKNELFGPVAIIIRVNGEDEAVRVANETEYGLSSAVCTRDLERGVMIAKRIGAGMTHVNDIPINDELVLTVLLGAKKPRATDDLGDFGTQ